MCLKAPAVGTGVGAKAKGVAGAALLEVEALALLASSSGPLWATELEFKDLSMGPASSSGSREATEFGRACLRAREPGRAVCGGFLRARDGLTVSTNYFFRTGWLTL